MFYAHVVERKIKIKYLIKIKRLSLRDKIRVMPKIVDYPHASFKNVFEIAAAVDYLGGSCSVGSCAERLKKKVSGAFKSLISGAMKHGLITSKKDVLSITELYRIHKLAYNDQERMRILRKSFLMPNLYFKIYERFRGKELPVSMLDKLLIREFGVEESYASRISGYFIDGAKGLNMLENGRLIDDNNLSKSEDVEGNGSDIYSVNEDNIEEEKNFPKEVSIENVTLPIVSNNNIFTVMIVGPGMNTKIEINEEDDLFILDAMIKKIKKKLKEGSE